MEEKNKTTYLKYALGEIILVVIGILIAVQLNNWNENRNKTTKAREFISDLKKEIASDTTVFGVEVRKIEGLIHYKSWVLTTQDFDSVPVEYLEGVSQIGYHNIKINMGTITRMRNSDAWSNKEYKNLFKSINTYYTFYEPYLNNLNEWEKKGSEKEFSFWNEQDVFEIRFSTLDSLDIPLVQNEVERKEKFVELLTSIKGKNYLNMSLMRENGMKKTYKLIHNVGKDLLLKIEEATKD